MADQALKNAEARRDTLAVNINEALQHVDEWKREVARIDAFVAAWHEFAGETQEPTQDDQQAPQADIDTELARSRPKNPPKEEVIEIARDIIRARGAPVSRRGIFAELENRGIHLEGSDPQMVLSTMLWRMKDKVVRLQGLGYWLTEVPYNPAGYDPQHQMPALDEAEGRMSDDEVERSTKGNVFDDIL